MSNRLGGTETNLIGGAVVLGLVVLIGISLGIGKSTCVGRLSASMDDVLNTANYSNDALLKDVTGFAYSRGEFGHQLYEVGGTAKGTASIQRLDKSGHRKASCFNDHPTVVAMINSSDTFDPLHLVGKQESNWFVVWHDSRETDSAKVWHGAMLSLTQRNKLDKFVYKEHYQRQPKPNDPDDTGAPLPDEVVKPIKDCWQAATPTRRACFVEVQKATPVTAVTGLGLRMFTLQTEGSVPWVACAQAGCCCGGTGCHTDE